MTGDGGELLEWVVRGFKEAPEWAQYEALLLGTSSERPIEVAPSNSAQVEVTDKGCQPQQDANIARHEAGAPPPNPKQIVKCCKVREKIRSNEKLASRIGIDRDTLNAIVNETRWVSDHTYELVAEFCKCKPQDLHPSDLPPRKSD